MFCREVSISLEVGGRRLMRLDVCVLGVSLTTSTGSGTAERRRFLATSVMGASGVSRDALFLHATGLLS